MASLPAQVTTGHIYWHVEADYMPPGMPSPLSQPCQGTIKVEPMRQSVNLDNVSGTHGMTLGFQSRTLTLVDGTVERDLPADFLNHGWDYKVTPSLLVMNDDGKYVPAGPDLNAPFSFHLAPGDNIDLADVRPVGKSASSGSFVSRGVGLTGEAMTNADGQVMFRLDDGTWTTPVTLTVNGGTSGTTGGTTGGTDTTTTFKVTN